jgi:ABC-type uncharacterized transport system permease subunit
MRLEPIPNPTLTRQLVLPAAALAATVVVASLLALLAGANPFAVLGQIGNTAHLYRSGRGRGLQGQAVEHRR